MAHDPASLIEPPARVTLAGNGWGVAAIVVGAVSGLAVGGECYAPLRDPLAVRRCWLAKAKRVCSPGEGKGDGSLLRPNLLPVGAFGKDHVTQASNFDTGVQDAAEVMHRLAPSGSMSLSTTRSQASPPRPGFVVGPRIG